MSNIKILGIAGSLRKKSHNRAALQAVCELLPKGVELNIFDLDDIPAFNDDIKGSPPAKIVELRQQIRDSDGILFATPEYNYSLPGAFKNAIDWASRPSGDSAWRHKPAAIMGASIGAFGSARAQYALREILVALDTPTVNKPEVMISDAAKKFDPQGMLTDEKSRELIAKLVKALVQLIQAHKFVGVAA